jgi:hypothetical protein
VGSNWLAWSKNGRIVQYSENETVSFDVRTKRVTCDEVPTMEVVKGLAAYGPGGKLFTIGPQNTVQQYDLNVSPPLMAQNVEVTHRGQSKEPPQMMNQPIPQKPKNVPKAPRSVRSVRSSSSRTSSLPVVQESETEDEYGQPIMKLEAEMELLEQQRIRRAPSVSSRSGPRGIRAPSVSGRSRVSRSSRMSKASKEGTEMSYGTGLVSDNESQFSSMSSILSSNLLNKYAPPPPAPVERPIDLFPFTKARLSDMHYSHPQLRPNMTASELRLQMLSCVFGWAGDIEGLIRDELSRHEPGSTSAFLIQKWLGDEDIDIGSMMQNDAMTSSDWMILALASMNSNAAANKAMGSMVQKLLQKGEVHTAAAMLHATGDHNDAIEVYVSHKLYIEAILLACLIFPNEWQRIAALVKSLGLHAVEHQHSQVAVRCFSCVVIEDAVPDEVSPVPESELISPSFSSGRGGGLKLVTTFENSNKSRPAKTARNDIDQTPLARRAPVALGRAVEPRSSPIAENHDDSDGPIPQTVTAQRAIGLPFRSDDDEELDERRSRGSRQKQREAKQASQQTAPADQLAAPMLLSSAKYEPKPTSKPSSQRSTGKSSTSNRESDQQNEAWPPGVKDDAAQRRNYNNLTIRPALDNLSTGNKMAQLASPPLTSQSYLSMDMTPPQRREPRQASLSRRPKEIETRSRQTSLSRRRAAIEDEDEQSFDQPLPTGSTIFSQQSNATDFQDDLPTGLSYVGGFSQPINESWSQKYSQGAGRSDFVSRNLPTAHSRQRSVGQRSVGQHSTGQQSAGQETSSRSIEVVSSRKDGSLISDRSGSNRHGRPIDRMMSSLQMAKNMEEESYRKENRREESRDRRGPISNEDLRGRRGSSMNRTPARSVSRDLPKSRNTSVVRYTSRQRSPTSPKPMSPNDLEQEYQPRGINRQRSQSRQTSLRDTSIVSARRVSDFADFEDQRPLTRSRMRDTSVVSARKISDSDNSDENRPTSRHRARDPSTRRIHSPAEYVTEGRNRRDQSRTAHSRVRAPVEERMARDRSLMRGTQV